MRLCIFILRFMSKMVDRWKSNHIEETFFLYDLESEESESLYN
jgi:hypothetical protein